MRRLACVLALFLFAPALFAKSIWWPNVDVNAWLDRDGVLHVTEQQTIHFDGDWNGGERVFDVRPSQDFVFERMYRIGAGGERIELTRGWLGDVDRYEEQPGHRVRWRSRLPSDPPFDQTDITYVLQFRYGRILADLGDGRYRLSHDFFVADRAGMVGHFHLKLDFEPEWNAPPVEITRDPLPPGQSVVFTKNIGARRAVSAPPPAEVNEPLPAGVLMLFGATLAAGLAWIVRSFCARERQAGRLETITDEVTEPWLEEHLLSMAPELAGAALRNAVGAEEVAAILARMTQEGKIASEMKNGELTLTRLEKELTPIEEKLCEALFLGEKKTDPTRVRRHYRNSGFSPAAIVQNDILGRLAIIRGWDENRSDVERFAIEGLLLVVTVAAMLSDGVDARALGSCAFALGIGALVATYQRHGINWFLARTLWVVAAIAPMVVVFFQTLIDARTLQPSLLFLLGYLATALASIKLVFDIMSTPESRAQILLRKRLVHARTFLKQQLRLEQPLLRDEWMPHLIALGLGNAVADWSRFFGPRAGLSATDSAIAADAVSHGSECSFTGGGGRFGGAGSTGGWTVAAGDFTADVAGPAAGGSVSSGGGSSGGGSGGGW